MTPVVTVKPTTIHTECLHEVLTAADEVYAVTESLSRVMAGRLRRRFLVVLGQLVPIERTENVRGAAL